MDGRGIRERKALFRKREGMRSIRKERQRGIRTLRRGGETHRREEEGKERNG